MSDTFRVACVQNTAGRDMDVQPVVFKPGIGDSELGATRLGQ